MALRASRYNRSVLDGDDCLVYNTLSGALVRMSVEEGVRLIAGEPAPADSPVLASRGFLVDEQLDELALARHRRDLNRHLSHEVNLVIVPTLACNFACPDCFALRTPGIMSDDTALAVLAWAEGRARISRRLKVEWFGGEPLLALDRLRELSLLLKDMCLRRACEYRATLVTNGQLLSPTVARQLRQAGVTHVQIALDGTKTEHDRHRPHHDGTGTFAAVWAGLLAAAEEMDVTVRVTVHPHSRPWDLYRQIRHQPSLGLVRTYFAPVHDRDRLTPDAPRSCAPQASFLGRVLGEVRQSLAEGDSLAGFDVPFLTFHAGCIARQPLAAAVGPDGSLYKCGKLVGRQWAAVGSVHDRSWAAGLVPGALHWHRLSAEGENCGDCQALPLCEGRCPAAELTGEESCPGTVRLLDEHIITIDRWLRTTGGEGQ